MERYSDQCLGLAWEDTELHTHTYMHAYACVGR